MILTMKNGEKEKNLLFEAVNEAAKQNFIHYKMSYINHSSA